MLGAWVQRLINKGVRYVEGIVHRLALSRSTRRRVSTSTVGRAGFSSERVRRVRALSTTQSRMEPPTPSIFPRPAVKGFDRSVRMRQSADLVGRQETRQ